ncbi:hypothetical protein SOVF_139880, partial [Spinacia oleracea]
VYSTSIDIQHQKVTISGNVESEILVKKLLKAGKHAEVWNEKPAEKAKKNDKESDRKSSETKVESSRNNEDKLKSIKGSDSAVKNNGKETNLNNKGNQNRKKSKQSPEAVVGDTGNAGKGNCVNACEGRFQGANQVEQLSEMSSNQTVDVMNYNADPSNFQVTTPPYFYHNTANDKYESCNVHTSTFYSLDIFSDDNPTGCSVM